MPAISRNIIDNSYPILMEGKAPYGSRITTLSLCNSGGAAVTISLFKVWYTNSNQTYLLLDNIVVAVGKTLIYQDLIIPGGWRLQLTINGGIVDMNIDYSVIISDKL